MVGLWQAIAGNAIEGEVREGAVDDGASAPVLEE
jgi:hypothetical protein